MQRNLSRGSRGNVSFIKNKNLTNSFDRSLIRQSSFWRRQISQKKTDSNHFSHAFSAGYNLGRAVYFHIIYLLRRPFYRESEVCLWSLCVYFRSKSEKFFVCLRCTKLCKHNGKKSSRFNKPENCEGRDCTNYQQNMHQSCGGGGKKHYTMAFVFCQWCKLSEKSV